MTSRSGERAPRWVWPALAVAYLALAIAATWPMALDLSGSVPQGTDADVTVPLASVWALWWGAGRLTGGPAGFWDAPIFHPVEGAFAFSEPMPLLGILSAPLFWLGIEPVAILNLVLLAALISGGLVAAGLLRGLGAPLWAAGVGGGVVVMLPYVHHELGVLTLVPMAGLLATIWAAIHFAESPSPGRGTLLGAALASAYLICGQHGIFLVIAGAPAGLWLVEGSWRSRRALLGVLTAALVAAALIGPVGATQREALDQHDFERSASRAVKGAATLNQWGRTPWPQAIPTPFVRQVRKGRALYPGTVLLALSLIGAFMGLRREDMRRPVGFVVTLGLLSWLGSMLPHLSLGVVTPYEWLRAVSPGLTRIRSLWRFAALTQLSLALLAAIGLWTLTPMLWRPWQGEGRQRALAAASRALLIGLACLAVLEMWPTGQRFGKSTRVESFRPLVAWIEAHTDEREPLAFVPVPGGSKVHHYAAESRRMVIQTAHRRPMLGGYSSYFPGSQKKMKGSLIGFPSVTAHAYLVEMGVRHVVAESAWMDRSGRRARVRPDLWRRVFVDEGSGVEVYAVESGPTR